MSAIVIVEIWLASSFLALIFFLWMMFDVIADYGAAVFAASRRIDGYGPEHVAVAKNNIVRECFRCAIELAFIAAGVLALYPPEWLPRASWLYILLLSNFLFTVKAILDRRMRVAVRHMLMESAERSDRAD